MASAPFDPPAAAPPIAPYPEVLARHYDADYAVLRRSQDVHFYLELAQAELRRFEKQRVAPGARPVVLEVACGTGRVLLPLARAGIPVIGVDPSAAMRELLLRKLRTESVEVRRHVAVHYGRFDRIPLRDGSVPLALSPFRAFQHLLERATQLAALREVARVLVPGGLFAFDVFDFNPAAVAASRDTTECRYEEEGRLVERRTKAAFDPRRRVLSAEFRWLSDGAEVGRCDMQLKVVSRVELSSLLAEAGFAVQALWGDFDKSPWDARRPRELVVLARAPS